MVLVYAVLKGVVRFVIVLIKAQESTCRVILSGDKSINGAIFIKRIDMRTDIGGQFSSSTLISSGVENIEFSSAVTVVSSLSASVIGVRWYQDNKEVCNGVGRVSVEGPS